MFTKTALALAIVLAAAAGALAATKKHGSGERYVGSQQQNSTVMPSGSGEGRVIDYQLFRD